MSINFAKFFRNLFGIKSTPAPAPTPTPIKVDTRANDMKPIAVVVYNDSKRPVAGATVKLDGNPNVYPQTNGDGYTIINVPMALQASQLTVIAPGFDTLSVHVDLPMHGEDLVVGPADEPVGPNQMLVGTLHSQHVDPSSIDLRTLAKIRGAMWTVRGAWRFGPRPGSPDNITALEYIYSYGDPMNASALNDEQKAMIATYKSKGYTHVAFGPINAESYHGQYPDTDFRSPEMFEKWLDWLQMFWDNGLAPICFLHGDGETFEQTVATMDHLIRGNARAQRLMRIIVPSGWEPTKYDWSSFTWAKFCAWGRDVLPNALVLIHTVSDVDAPVGTDALGDDNNKATNPNGNGDGWSRVTPHIHGWLIQNGPYSQSPAENPTLASAFAGQFQADGNGAVQHGARWHFVNRIAAWPSDSAWGNEPIKIYNAECTSYNAYWNNLPYDKSTAWGDLAIASGADGYLDSGTVAVP
jgi:hypothetical protein